MNRYIPKGATKVISKTCEAEAYLFQNGDRLFAIVYWGRQSKPLWYRSFPNTERRVTDVTRAFVARAEWEARQQKRRDDRNAETHGLQVGHVLKASWGYDQTNVNFYQITKIISLKMVELRPIGSMTGETQTSMSGTVLPVIDKFTGEPMRKRAGRGGIRIDSSRYAFVWDGKPVFESSWH